MRVQSRPRPTRWTEECTAILMELSGTGATDQRIADEIERRTGQRFHRNKVQSERRDRMIDACWCVVAQPYGGRLVERRPD